MPRKTTQAQEALQNQFREIIAYPTTIFFDDSGKEIADLIAASTLEFALPKKQKIHLVALADTLRTFVENRKFREADRLYEYTLFLLNELERDNKMRYSAKDRPMPYSKYTHHIKMTELGFTKAEKQPNEVPMVETLKEYVVVFDALRTSGIIQPTTTPEQGANGIQWETDIEDKAKSFRATMNTIRKLENKRSGLSSRHIRLIQLLIEHANGGNAVELEVIIEECKKAKNH